MFHNYKSHQYLEVENPIDEWKWTIYHTCTLLDVLRTDFDIDLSDGKSISIISDFCYTKQETDINHSSSPLLNLSDRNHRVSLFGIILILWTIPTIALYGIPEQLGYTISIFQLSAVLIIFVLSISSVLITIFNCGTNIKIMIGILFIASGVVYFISTIFYAHNHCRDTVTIDNSNAHCYVGIIGTQLLGALMPIYVGLDFMINIKSKYIHIYLHSFILFVTMILNIATIMYYGNGVECIDQGTDCLNSTLYIIFSSGFWLLLIGSILTVIQTFVHRGICTGKNRLEGQYKNWFKAASIIISCILIVGIAFILIESDVCIAGLELSDASYFCYYRLSYLLLALILVIVYQLLTF